jgi:hypothetical protein
MELVIMACMMLPCFLNSFYGRVLKLFQLLRPQYNTLYHWLKPAQWAGPGASTHQPHRVCRHKQCVRNRPLQRCPQPCLINNRLGSRQLRLARYEGVRTDTAAAATTATAITAGAAALWAALDVMSVALASAVQESA